MKADTNRQAKWRILVEEQSTSGLTQATFCKDRNIVLSQFVYYRGLIRAKENKSAASNQTFTPIQVSKIDSNSASEIRIILPNGFQCYVSSRIEVLQIKRLVEALLTC